MSGRKAPTPPPADAVKPEAPPGPPRPRRIDIPELWDRMNSIEDKVDMLSRLLGVEELPQEVRATPFQDPDEVPPEDYRPRRLAVPRQKRLNRPHGSTSGPGRRERPS